MTFMYFVCKLTVCAGNLGINFPQVYKNFHERKHFPHKQLIRRQNWSESWDSCFESLNGSVVSGKILVLAVLAIFGSKIHCMW